MQRAVHLRTLPLFSPQTASTRKPPAAPHINRHNDQRLVDTKISASGAASSGDASLEQPATSQHLVPDQAGTNDVSFLGKVKRFFGSGKLDKEKLASLGIGAFAAYGLVSNVNAGVLITIAWVTVLKKTSKTPLQDGNWPLFLAVYAGLWVSSHFMRPIRLSIALGLAPTFNKALEAIQAKTGQNKAIALVLLFGAVAVCSVLFTGTLVTVFSALATAPLPAFMR